MIGFSGAWQWLRRDFSARRLPGSSSGRRLIVHAGLHKTGTTSIQEFLADNADELRRHGVLYPKTGTSQGPRDGHHNIAWQLTRDRRFMRAWGTVDELAEEIGAFDGDALVSSEDFEGVLHKPRTLSRLWRHPAMRGRSVSVVIYVRSQHTYLESLYIEMMEHGIADEFTRFAAPLFKQRRLPIREWVFQFDYAALQAAWRRRGARLVIRNYHQLHQGSVVADFVSLACPALSLAAEMGDVRSNPRPPVSETLAQFYSARVGREAQPYEARAVSALCEFLGDRPARPSAPFAAHLAARFAPSNQRLCAQSRLPSPGLLDRPAPAGPIAAMERLFSRETHNLIAASPADPDSADAYRDRLRVYAEQLKH